MYFVQHISLYSKQCTFDSKKHAYMKTLIFSKTVRIGTTLSSFTNRPTPSN